MQLLEQKSFIEKIIPFNRLDTSILEQMCSFLDIVYFQENEYLYKKDKKPDSLFFIIKGVVQEVDEDEILSVYSNGDFFDPIVLIENKIKYDYIVKQETICYTLPRQVFLKTMYANQELESYFFQSIAEKLNSHLRNEHNKELTNFMMAKVSDAYLQKPILVDEKMSIYDATAKLIQEKGSCLVVSYENGSHGIVTDTDFKKIITQRIDFQAQIKEVATKTIKTINENEFLFNAQIQMNSYNIKRLIVLDDKQNITGVLDLLALTSFFASHTYSVILEIDNTQSIEELKKASKKFLRVIRALYVKGVKVRYISKVISQLNNKLFRRLYELTAPIELQNQAALIIMGSEGRAEQILRTDQDNALILDDKCTVDRKIIEDFTQTYTKHLIDFGYPKCDGNIMVSNPYWVKTKSEFEKTIYNWVHSASAENFMNFAIFYDSFCVAGNKYLLVDLKEYLFSQLTMSQSFYSFFAKPILNFETPLGLFANFIVDKKDHKDELDLKKGGIFPIVHGVRSLALEKKIKKTYTPHRIKLLTEKGIFDEKFSKELIETFTFLLSLRLKFRFEKIDAKMPIDNYINPDKLSSLERDLLKESFKVVDKFKKLVSFHFHLGNM